MARTPEDYAHELDALDAAHAQNEAGRDAFIALAHTALFAASVSFVGDVASLGDAIWRPALIAGWLASVVGLVALTVSFGVARKNIDARRAALNDDDPPGSHFLERLNSIALWSFPIALLCLFSFVTANVVNTDVRQTQPTAVTSKSDGEGGDAASEGSQPRRRSIEALDRSGASPSGPSSIATPVTADTAAEEVKSVEHDKDGI